MPHGVATVPDATTTIAVVRTQDDMIEALRRAKDMLGLSNAWCDAIGGLTSGHTDKVIGPSRTKSLSQMTFDLFCELFAVEFHMVVNIDAAQRMADRWEGRNASNVRVESNRVSAGLLERAKRHILVASAKHANAARNQMLTREQKAKIARKAARARWRKRRERERAAKAERTVL